MAFQVRVVVENLLDRASGRQLTKNSSDRDAGVPDARQSTHPARGNADPLVHHAAMVRARIITPGVRRQC